ncbi:MAG: hypothetical protein H6R18_1553 [Proteobacteria bacterium]|nr:hypothetical protein [Pseudomonadota bacterium]
MRLTFLLLISLLLTACAPDKPGCARLPGGGSYCLQSGAGPNFSTLQQSVLSAGDQRMTLLTRIENDTRGLRFAGMTPLGQTLMFVSWENGVLRADLPPEMASRLDPALFPAMVQIAMWPPEMVRAGLSPELELIAEPNRRRLRLKEASGDDILDISWEGNLPYQRLKIVAPAGMRIDARALDDAEDAK